MRKWIAAAAVMSVMAPGVVWAQGRVKAGHDVVNRISVAKAEKMDAAAEKVLKETGTPSASVAVVENGKIVYTHGYGLARLDPPTKAEPYMRYSIGSISKQFTAAALLMLQQEGKLSLGDPVAKYFPDLTDAKDVTLKMLLSHTSGYQDYWPEDYVMPPMEKPTNTQHILDVWAKRPLDFAPGTRWQYSNTNYVIAGLIVEKVSGMPLMQFLQERIFKPLKMRDVMDSDLHDLGKTDAAGYQQYALGPLRPATKEGPGWGLGAFELAMPAYDLAQWDISLMDRSLMSQASYDEMFTPVDLKDGRNTHYALGLSVGTRDGHAYLEHSGEVSGFVSENIVFPKAKAAIVVLTNEMASPAASAIGRALTPLVLGTPESAVESEEAKRAEAQAMEIFTGLQHGKIDRAKFTDWCNAYFSQQAMEDYQNSLGPLGRPASIQMTGQSLRGGMTFRDFRVTFPDGKNALTITTYTEPDGKLEQFLVLPVPKV
ncbi:MAG: serine hydrolase domain-containing protein [Acidobacteriaceae bacterium]